MYTMLILQLSEMEEEVAEEAKAGDEAPTSEYSSSIELLTLFQRLLLCIIYSHIPSTPGDTGMEPERGMNELRVCPIHFLFLFRLYFGGKTKLKLM